MVLVGIGGYGGAYVREVLKAPADSGVKLVGVVDPQPQRCKMLRTLKRRHVPVFDSLEEFYRCGSADLAVIASPIHCHRPQTLLALANGAAVLCEKPVAGTIQDARAMFDAAQTAGRPLAIGYQWSYSDAIQSLKRDILAGELGRPVRLRTLACWPRPLSYYTRNNWAGRLRSDDGAWVLDGPANNATAHFLHNMFYVLGPTRTTSATPAAVQAELYRAKPIENYDTAAIRCRTSDDVEIVFVTTHSTADGRGPVFCYEFDKAVVAYDGDGAEQIVAEFHNGARRIYGDPAAGHMSKFWQAVAAGRGEGEVDCPIEAGMAQTLCVNGAQESMPQIATLPADVIRRTDSQGDQLVWVVGLGDVLEACCDRGVLPSELDDVAWARPGRAVDLRGYEFFPSGER